MRNSQQRSNTLYYEHEPSMSMKAWDYKKPKRQGQTKSTFSLALFSAANTIQPYSNT